MTLRLATFLAAIAWSSVAICAPAEAAVVHGSSVSLTWQPSQGPVVNYGVWVLRDGASASGAPDMFVDAPTATVSGSNGEAIHVQVAPFDAAGAQGPLSAQSGEIIFSFAAGSAVLPYDFDGDGHSDLVWRNRLDGSVEVWLMDEFGPFERMALEGVSDMNWRLGGSADFDADGRADILWSNAKTGDSSVWLMNGATPHDVVALESAGPGWMSMATGDVTDSGDARVVLSQRKSGSNWLRHLDQLLPTAEFALPDSGSEIVASCDFDGDDVRDLMLHRKGKRNARLWLMKSGGYVEAYRMSLPSRHMTFVGCADLDASGREGAIWRDERNGTSTLWSNERWTSNGFVYGTLSYLGGSGVRSVRASGDFDGDGRDDLLLRSTHGGTSIVLTGANGVPTRRVVAQPLDGSWQVVSR